MILFDSVTSLTLTSFLEAGGGQGAGGRVAVQRSPSAIKDMLLAWCKQMTKDYEVCGLRENPTRFLLLFF